MDVRVLYEHPAITAAVSLVQDTAKRRKDWLPYGPEMVGYIGMWRYRTAAGRCIY